MTKELLNWREMQIWLTFCIGIAVFRSPIEAVYIAAGNTQASQLKMTAEHGTGTAKALAVTVRLIF